MIESWQWEKDLLVVTPEGHPGKAQLTRREIGLLEQGRGIVVRVLGKDGLIRRYHSTLLELPKPDPTIEVVPEEDLYGKVVSDLMAVNGWNRDQVIRYLNTSMTTHDLLKHISNALGDLSDVFNE